MKIERKKFDKEYSTSYRAEVEYLKACGIRYEFVKLIDDISIYKYRKTSRLFAALRSFYDLLEDTQDKRFEIIFNNRRDKMIT